MPTSMLRPNAAPQHCFHASPWDLGSLGSGILMFALTARIHSTASPHPSYSLQQSPAFCMPPSTYVLATFRANLLQQQRTDPVISKRMLKLLENKFEGDCDDDETHKHHAEE